MRGPGLLVLDKVVRTLALALFIFLAATCPGTGSPCDATLTDSAGSLSSRATAAVQARTTGGAPASARTGLGGATDYATTPRASDPSGSTLGGTCAPYAADAGAACRSRSTGTADHAAAGSSSRPSCRATDKASTATEATTSCSAADRSCTPNRGRSSTAAGNTVNRCTDISRRCSWLMRSSSNT